MNHYALFILYRIFYTVEIFSFDVPDVTNLSGFCSGVSETVTVSGLLGDDLKWTNKTFKHRIQDLFPLIEGMSTIREQNLIPSKALHSAPPLAGA